MAYDVTFTQAILCKGAMRTVGSVLNVDDETARMLVDLGVATASGLSPQTGSSAAIFADTFLAKTDNLSTVASVPVTRTNLDVPSTTEVTSEIASATVNFPRKAGTWVNTTAYNVGDFVLFNNGSFVCVQANTGRNPVAELAYWQMVSTGWNWMRYNNTNLPFANQRTVGSGVDANNYSSTTCWARVGLNTNTGTTTNAVATYRTLSIGVPTYWHKLYDSSGTSSSNAINYAKAGRFQTAFQPALGGNAATGGTVFYLDVGRTYSTTGTPAVSPVDGTLDKRGYGIRLVVNAAGNGLSAAYAVFHDGTTLTETSFDPLIVQSQMNKLEITWDGTGTMIWFINGTEVWRTTSGLNDVYGFPTYGAIALGAYNNVANGSTTASQMIWMMAEETYFVTYGG